MRTITNNAVNAFLNAQSFKSSNTTVEIESDKAVLKLHGNTIAINNKGKISITNAGWQTNTTKERLNAIPNVNIRQVKGVWFLNSKQWDGKLIDIS